MGMFDYIKSEYPLPLPENQGELAGRNWRENGFQTKDFECLLDRYCIREDGTLWQQTCPWETNRKGSPRRNPAGWEPLNPYTGTVHFYDGIGGTKADYWVEWRAVFVMGKVIELKLHRWEEQDNRERLASESKWKLENERRDLFLKTWIGRCVYPRYARVVHGCLHYTICRLCDWVASQCSRAGRWINRARCKLAPYGDPIRAERRRRKWNDRLKED